MFTYEILDNYLSVYDVFIAKIAFSFLFYQQTSIYIINMEILYDKLNFEKHLEWSIIIRSYFFRACFYYRYFIQMKKEISKVQSKRPSISEINISPSNSVFRLLKDKGSCHLIIFMPITMLFDLPLAFNIIKHIIHTHKNRIQKYKG